MDAADTAAVALSPPNPFKDFYWFFSTKQNSKFSNGGISFLSSIEMMSWHHRYVSIQNPPATDNKESMLVSSWHR